jgi:hypothetical protein
MLASSTFPTAPQSHMIGQGPIPSTGRPTSAPALDILLPGHGREIIVQQSPQSSTLPGIPQDAGFTRALFGEASPDDRRHPVPVRIGARYRTIQTGGGLQCPGRLEPSHRARGRLPQQRRIICSEIGRSFPDPESTSQPPSTTTLISIFRRATLRGFRDGG